MSETWYELAPWCVKRIIAVEVDKSTPTTITIKGRRRNISTGYYTYFKTYAKAREAAIDKAEADVEAAEQSLRNANAAAVAAESIPVHP